jgi:hypothetical protein
MVIAPGLIRNQQVAGSMALAASSPRPAAVAGSDASLPDLLRSVQQVSTTSQPGIARGNVVIEKSAIL